MLTRGRKFLRRSCLGHDTLECSSSSMQLSLVVKSSVRVGAVLLAEQAFITIPMRRLLLTFKEDKT